MTDALYREVCRVPWDDLTAEEREVLIGVVPSSPWPQTAGEWLGRWADLRAAVRDRCPGADTRNIEESARVELCRRYRNRPSV